MCVQVCAYAGVPFTFQNILLHCLAKLPCDRGAACHSGTAVDLNEPWPEVWGDHEVCSVELKGVRCLRLYHFLGGLEHMDDSRCHAGVDDSVPEVGAIVPLHAIGGEGRGEGGSYSLTT